MAEAAGKLEPSPGQSWWDDEVRSLLRAAPELGPAARALVAGVLHALAADPTTDTDARSDLETLLEAIEGADANGRGAVELVARVRRLVPSMAA